MTKKLEARWESQKKQPSALFGMHRYGCEVFQEIFCKHITLHLTHREFLNLNLVSKEFWLTLHAKKSIGSTAAKAYQQTLNGLTEMNGEEVITNFHDLSCRAYDYTREYKYNNELLIALFGSLHHFLKLPLITLPERGIKAVAHFKYGNAFSQLPPFFRIKMSLEEMIMIKYTLYLPKETCAKATDSVWHETLLIIPMGKEGGLNIIDTRCTRWHDKIRAIPELIEQYGNRSISNDAYTHDIHQLIDSNKINFDGPLVESCELRRLQNLVNKQPLDFFRDSKERPNYIEGTLGFTFKGARKFRDLPVLLGHVGIEAFEGLFQSEIRRDHPTGKAYEYITF